MEQQHLKRLHDEQKKAIDETQDKIHGLEKFRADYISLQDRMKSLPDRMTYDVMVPFGKKAFIPGQLVHTNEILVLLGDNWFAEKSAKQASETVGRRLSVLDKQVKELEQQLQLLTPRLNFTSELRGMAEQTGDIQEIKEDFDVNKEKAWREKHKESLRRYNKQQREEHKQFILEDEKKQKEKEKMEQSDAQLWARLEELELLEDDRGELNETDSSTSDGGESDESSTSHDSLSEDHKKVKWKDEPVRKSSSNVIWFSHTPSTDKEANSDTSQHKENEPNMEIESPRDIHRRFASNAPQSILKQKSSSSIANDTNSLGNKLSNIIDEKCGIGAKPKKKTLKPEEKDTFLVFSEKVVETSLQQSSISTDITPKADLADDIKTDIVEQPKKVSKFKARRMQSKQ